MVFSGFGGFKGCRGLGVCGSGVYGLGVHGARFVAGFLVGLAS